jgi:hypothetical protein
MYHELKDTPGHTLRKMVGKYDTVAELVKASGTPTKLYVPMDFAFCRDIGDCLPLVSIQFHLAALQIKLAPIEKMIVVSHCDCQVVRCVDGAPITKQDINVYLATNYIYLDMAERDVFAEGGFDMVIKQTQSYYSTTKGGSNTHVSLNFNHPCTFMVWGAQRECMARKNQTFNYSGAFGQHLLTNMKLSLNSLCVFQNTPEYFNQVQPWQCFNNIPENMGIYTYSWALYPLSNQPSGSVNMSRIDSIDFDCCLQPACQNETIAFYIFAENYNVLKVKDGLAGLMFSSNPVFAGSQLAVKWI